MASGFVDPNGHNLFFVEYTSDSKQALARGKHLGSRRVSDRLLPVGITITDEEAANTPYRDALGFQEILAPAFRMASIGCQDEEYQAIVSQFPGFRQSSFQLTHPKRSF